MTFQTVSVLGAGTMGHALAVVHALGGCAVRLTDTHAPTLSVAQGRIGAALETLAEAGTISTAEAAAAQARIQPVSSLAEALDGSELIVEAVVENADVKSALFAEIDRLASVDAVLASNTSFLDVFPLIPERRRTRALIAHWYTPPYIIDLVDLVPAPECDPEVMHRVQDLYEACGKAVLVFERFLPGYIANRLQAALNLECLRLIDEGMATPEQIDMAVRDGLAARMALLGHMRKADFTGLEMMRNGLRARTYEPPRATGGSATLDRLIDAGRTGVKSGAGFYDYDDAKPEDLLRARDLKLLKLKAAIAAIDQD
ncbi:3-hydroxyacyl-CoA dehydrogenase family protein [Oceanibium sediminis]|uniref:3-hydroxyacyl-CoA dehydrogenase family protein n=1 Tax=Oceanibium sediminis TaxID=2026339 RepID=UPI000DD2BC94|nr:3-hydroxyacyl-CoA dehydrogenase family protein [Oceanibium sediminis]